LLILCLIYKYRKIQCLVTFSLLYKSIEKLAAMRHEILRATIAYVGPCRSDSDNFLRIGLLYTEEILNLI